MARKIKSVLATTEINNETKALIRVAKASLARWPSAMKQGEKLCYESNQLLQIPAD
jgi:hypothetical protein